MCFKMSILATLWRMGWRKGPGDVMWPPLCLGVRGGEWAAGSREHHSPAPYSTRISDIRLFHVDARPAMAATKPVSMTTFLNKELADENQTLKEATTCSMPSSAAVNITARPSQQPHLPRVSHGQLHPVGTTLPPTPAHSCIQCHVSSP